MFLLGLSTYYVFKDINGALACIVTMEATHCLFLMFSFRFCVEVKSALGMFCVLVFLSIPEKTFSITREGRGRFRQMKAV